MSNIPPIYGYFITKGIDLYLHPRGEQYIYVVGNIGAAVFTLDEAMKAAKLYHGKIIGVLDSIVKHNQHGKGI